MELYKLNLIKLNQRISVNFQDFCIDSYNNRKINMILLLSGKLANVKLQKVKIFLLKSMR